MSQTDLIETIRTTKPEPQITKNEMPTTMKEEAILFAKEAFEQCNSFFDIAKYLKSKFDEKYKKRWHCLVYEQNHGSHYSTYKRGDYINLKFDNLTIVIFRPASV